jgi:phosphate-selective porin OprO and OprP
MERQRFRRLLAGFVLTAAGCVLSIGLPAAAQDAAPAPPPPIPAPALPAAAPTAREAALEARVQQLEAMVQQLAVQQPVAPGAVGTPGGFAPGNGPDVAATGEGPSTTGVNVGAANPNAPAGSTNPNASYRNVSGPMAPGQGTPANPPPSERFSMPARAYNFPLAGRFGPGFEWRSDDDEYVLQFHDLTQVDFRGYEQGGQNPVHDTFGIPRQWFMFSGRLEKPYEYFVSIQNAIDVVNMLDVFLNVHYDDRLQLKFGRYKTPFTYEFYSLPIQGVIQPERSLFFNNFGLNRSIGIDLWGQLFDKTLDYAVGVFDQARNSYVDVADGKAFLGFLNWKPFGTWLDSPLENINLGGSVMYANAANTPNPVAFRTAIATTGNNVFGVPFLTFNNNAREFGTRALWTAHAAWYYNHLSVISEFGGGYQSYALSSSLYNRVKVPVDSWYIQAGYFITGETVSGRNVVRPLHNFDLRPGFRGPGAIELTARYQNMALGNQIFTGGFVDPNQNTKSLYMTDVGVNWSWTQTIKWMFDWEHAVFGSPVVFAPGRTQLTSDLFWVRMQVFF